MSERTTLPDDKPPLVGWFVVEVDIEQDRESPLYTSIRGPYPTKEKAEHERDEQQKAWQRALDERGEESPYDFKGWDIVSRNIPDFQIEKLEREDEESYQIRKDAADAVSAALLADEGITPMSGGGPDGE